MIKTPTDLRAWRRARGLSQPDLARLVGVSSKTVSNWEVGAFGLPAGISERLARSEVPVKPRQRVTFLTHPAFYQEVVTGKPRHGFHRRPNHPGGGITGSTGRNVVFDHEGRFFDEQTGAELFERALPPTGATSFDAAWDHAEQTGDYATLGKILHDDT